MERTIVGLLGQCLSWHVLIDFIIPLSNSRLSLRILSEKKKYGEKEKKLGKETCWASNTTRMGPA